MADTTLALAIELIRCPSVTPEDAGCQQLLAGRLEALGFRCHHLRFGEVENLWAVHGDRGPLFVFAGHTDVVPSGPAGAWQSDPFEPQLREGMLYGRGAADMKGSLAAMTTACERLLARGTLRGRLALLLTSDEEGPAVDGTRRVIEWLQQCGERIDWCVVGEPSSEHALGDTLRIGRRGSLSATLRVHGVQGHVAYPERARNPIHTAAPALADLAATRWDEGNAHFPPTTLAISNIHAGTGAGNVIPGELVAQFNLRFGTASTPAGLRERIETLFARHALECSVEWTLGAEPFLTSGGELCAAACAAIRARLAREPQLSTGGGTSDGRFIAPLGTQLIELGPCNATIHKVDECVRADDLGALSLLYEDIAAKLLLQ